MPDVIQIGKWVISKTAFDVLVPLLSGLIGVLAGGFVTYLTSKSIEDRKWNRELKYKRQEEKRKSIAMALEWIEPLQQALSKAMLLSSRYQMYGDQPPMGISQEEFNQKYPDVISTLAKHDLPANLRVLLPGDAYKKSFEIIAGLEDLRILPLRGIKEFGKAGDLINSLQTKLDSLQQALSDEYEKTYHVD